MKYVVYLVATGGASYDVEADNEEQAKEKAWKMANLADVEFSDWDSEIEPDVTEIILLEDS